jgi:hypothetical protein
LAAGAGAVVGGWSRGTLVLRRGCGVGAVVGRRGWSAVLSGALGVAPGPVVAVAVPAVDAVDAVEGTNAMPAATARPADPMADQTVTTLTRRNPRSREVNRLAGARDM